MFLSRTGDRAEFLEHKCRGGGPSIVHLFGYPAHIRVNLGCWQWSQAESTACNSRCGRAKMPQHPLTEGWRLQQHGGNP